MKKLFIFILLTVAGMCTVSAQSQYKFISESIDTALNADTIAVNVTNMPSNLKSITGTLKRLSGSITTAGYALVQVTNDAFVWNDANTDTLKFTNTQYNSKTWTFTTTSFNSYRVVFRIPTGTETSIGYLTYVRRPDE